MYHYVFAAIIITGALAYRFMDLNALKINKVTKTTVVKEDSNKGNGTKHRLVKREYDLDAELDNYSTEVENT